MAKNLEKIFALKVRRLYFKKVNISNRKPVEFSRYGVAGFILSSQYTILEYGREHLKISEV